jgi:hypothetical protein
MQQRLHSDAAPQIDGRPPAAQHTYPPSLPLARQPGKVTWRVLNQASRRSRATPRSLALRRQGTDSTGRGGLADRGKASRRLASRPLLQNSQICIAFIMIEVESALAHIGRTMSGYQQLCTVGNLDFEGQPGGWAVCLCIPPPGTNASICRLPSVVSLAALRGPALCHCPGHRATGAPAGSPRLARYRSKRA